MFCVTMQQQHTAQTHPPGVLVLGLLAAQQLWVRDCRGSCSEQVCVLVMATSCVCTPVGAANDFLLPDTVLDALTHTHPPFPWGFVHRATTPARNPGSGLPCVRHAAGWLTQLDGL